ncbi:ABC transporter ATP-binding protein [Fannyhessea vaginae]|uniref:ABC transporter ATP-binding protein n=1 Tax=Fannyhessea vaginae TaxID=82135 RepID=UPI0023F2F5F2|nr:ATP-binding cassette domain-containing protein [Fannyhessea vaginae]
MALSCSHITCSYQHDSAFVLRELSLTCKSGMRIALVGSNGAGKSTLVNVLAGHVPFQAGHITLDGYTIAPNESLDVLTRARLCGFVHQDPYTQCVSPSVFDTLAFGPLNLGLSEQDVHARVKEALEFAHISYLAGRMLDTLSGGEMQRVAFAATLALHPHYLVLDEAFSQLDPISSQQLHTTIECLVRTGFDGAPLGVIEITHNAQDLKYVDKVAVLYQGKIAAEVSPSEFLSNPTLQSYADFIDESSYMSVMSAQDPFILADNACEAQLLPTVAHAERTTCIQPTGAHNEGTQPTLVVSNLVPRPLGDAASYRGNQSAASYNFSLYPGELTLVVGSSGSGKTTLALNLIGACKPQQGSVTLNGLPVALGDCAFMFQRVEDQLFCPTVLDEVTFGLKNQGLSCNDAARKAEKMLSLLGVSSDTFERNPYQLSGGMRKRVGIAAILALDKPVYILDECTSGLDGAGRRLVRRVIRMLLDQHKSVMVITHHMSEWEEIPHKLLMVRDSVTL